MILPKKGWCLVCGGTPHSWVQLASGKWPIRSLKSSWKYGDMTLWDVQFAANVNRNDVSRLCPTSRGPHVSSRPRGLHVYWSQHTFVRHWNSRTNKVAEYLRSSLTNMSQTLVNYLEWGIRLKQKQLNVSSYSDIESLVNFLKRLWRIKIEFLSWKQYFPELVHTST
jgi:hypothetical protein